MAERWDALDILVNNAGANWGVPLAEQDSKSWHRVLDVNVEGVFHTTKFLLPLLQAAGTAEEPARIINIGSVDGIQVPGFETYAYSASKAAVHQLTRHLAKHLAPDDHRERHRARAVPVADDAGHPRGGRRRDGAR